MLELARHLVPAGYVVDKLKYFTARVSGVSNKTAPARQQAFLAALHTLPEVEVPSRVTSVHIHAAMLRAAQFPL